MNSTTYPYNNPPNESVYNADEQINVDKLNKAMSEEFPWCHLEFLSWNPYYSLTLVGKNVASGYCHFFSGGGFGRQDFYKYQDENGWEIMQNSDNRKEFKRFIIDNFFGGPDAYIVKEKIGKTLSSKLYPLFFNDFWMSLCTEEKAEPTLCLTARQNKDEENPVVKQIFDIYKHKQNSNNSIIISVDDFFELCDIIPLLNS